MWIPHTPVLILWNDNTLPGSFPSAAAASLYDDGFSDDDDQQQQQRTREQEEEGEGEEAAAMPPSVGAATPGAVEPSPPLPLPTTAASIAPNPPPPAAAATVAAAKQRAEGEGEEAAGVRVLHQGWMEKKGAYTGVWRRRYLRLGADGVLRYCGSDGGWVGAVERCVAFPIHPP